MANAGSVGSIHPAPPEKDALDPPVLVGGEGEDPAERDPAGGLDLPAAPHATARSQHGHYGE